MRTRKTFRFDSEQIKFNNQDYLVDFIARCERERQDVYSNLDLTLVEVDNIQLYLDTEDGSFPFDINDLSNDDYEQLVKQLEEYVSEQDLDWDNEEFVDDFGHYDRYAKEWV